MVSVLRILKHGSVRKGKPLFNLLPHTTPEVILTEGVKGAKNEPMHRFVSGFLLIECDYRALSAQGFLHGGVEAPHVHLEAAEA